MGGRIARSFLLWVLVLGCAHEVQMGSYVIAAGGDDGVEVAGVWAGGASPIFLSDVATSIAGFRFTTLPINTFTDSGIPLATPLNRTQAATTITALNLVMEINPVVSGGILTVNFVDELDPNAFGATPNLPSERTVVVAGTVTIPTAVLQTVTIPLFTQAATLANFTRLQARHRAIGWDQKLAFTVTYDDNSLLPTGVDISSFEGGGVIPTLTTTELPEVTGINKHWQAHSRADRCPRCGTLTVREKLVEDGFKRGLLVCQPCWDPPDFHEEWGRRGVGREREGIND